ncbi:MAG TPA: ABC transporter permease subunit [Kineosporiaceae bacterium]|nr:ABC transporter permease subunit [Kineosporiaceae bacterium]
MTESIATADDVAGDQPSGAGRRLPLSWLGAVPFFAYVGIFLLLPTGVVIFQAFFTAAGQPTLANIKVLTTSVVVEAFINTITLSAVSAVLGAALGAVLAYMIASGPADGLTRRLWTAVAGLLAQFGGVTLAFAFLATAGPVGLITLALSNLGFTTTGAWLTNLSGLVVVYTYFQIPLMVLVFLPALDGIRPQWREAAESLGGTSWQYWRHVAIPLLTAPFLGATLLLFANAFAAYATAAALISQGGIIIPLQIRIALSSETVAGQENVAKALALGMIIVVAVAMTLYAMMQRRSARWLR